MRPLLARFKRWRVRVHEKPRFIPIPFGLGHRPQEPRGDYCYKVTSIGPKSD